MWPGVFLCGRYHVHGSVVVVLPVEVEVFDADAGGVGAGQQDCGAVHGFHWRHFSCGDLQAPHTPHPWTWENTNFVPVLTSCKDRCESETVTPGVSLPLTPGPQLVHWQLVHCLDCCCGVSHWGPIYKHWATRAPVALGHGANTLSPPVVGLWFVWS